MKVKPIEEIINFLTEIATPMDIKVIDVEVKQGKAPAITVFIDTEDGVDLDTCERFHRAIDLPLDEFNPTFDAPYTLNVSSPGADRPFKTDEDFNSRIGEKVEVWLKTAIKGKKYYDGILKKYDGHSVVIEVDKKTTLSIELKSTEKVNDYIDFE